MHAISMCISPSHPLTLLTPHPPRCSDERLAALIATRRRIEFGTADAFISHSQVIRTTTIITITTPFISHSQVTDNLPCISPLTSHPQVIAQSHDHTHTHTITITVSISPVSPPCMQLDDEALKWNELDVWALRFQREHGRWPLVWYDLPPPSTAFHRLLTPPHASSRLPSPSHAFH